MCICFISLQCKRFHPLHAFCFCICVSLTQAAYSRTEKWIPHGCLSYTQGCLEKWSNPYGLGGDSTICWGPREKFTVMIVTIITVEMTHNFHLGNSAKDQTDQLWTINSATTSFYILFSLLAPLTVWMPPWSADLHTRSCSATLTNVKHQSK